MLNETEEDAGEKVGIFERTRMVTQHDSYDLKRETLMRGTARRVDAKLA